MKLRYSYPQKRLLYALCAAVFPIPLYAQGFSVGLIGGVELSSDFQYRRGGTFSGIVFNDVPTTVRIANERTRFAPKLGLKIEYEFTTRWSLETGLLIHRPVATSTATFDPPIRQFSLPASPFISRQVSRYDEAIWEVPLLVNRSFRVGRGTLILEGGPSFRPFGGIDGPGRFGMTGGIGTMWRTNRVRLQPSVRYTRWSDVRQPYTPAPFRRDEISVLLAVDTRAANPTSAVWCVGKIFAGIFGAGSVGDKRTVFCYQASRWSMPFCAEKMAV